ncbi:MBL fold metallo-hydrolase [Comamonadaceae bacterium PP-2]
MVRPAHLLYPPRVPAALRAAATVILLRDTPQGLEVLMTRRSAHASFAPGAYVFPGGGVDAADDSADAHAMSTQRPGQSDLRLTQAITAIRECFEELGVLLAYDAQGNPVSPAEISALRRDSHNDAGAFVRACSEQGLVLACDQLFVLAHWITDRDLPRRFDVPFLVARMPEGQQPVADEQEQFEPVWIRPCDALARHDAGHMLIIFPTYRTLQWLCSHTAVDAVLRACGLGNASGRDESPQWTSCPRAGLMQGREARFMEHEPPYGELALVCPDGQIVHELAWQHERPVALLKNLRRLTAPNPGAMTGPGTNSYIVGTPASGFIVIDPGPAEASHIERLLQATQGDIRAIVCTHSHPDHAPAAWLLQALCQQRTRLSTPVLGLSSGPHADPASRFVPDRELLDGERLSLLGFGVSHTLRVVHTPGHAANHVCLLFEEEGLLFTGDHVLNGSTTVIRPPDGHMGDYMASLERLQALCEQHNIGTLLPAHGYALGPAVPALVQLKRHRHSREARVIEALAASPNATVEELLPHVYADVPQAMWPVAAGSLQAHLDHVRQAAAGSRDALRQA